MHVPAGQGELVTDRSERTVSILGSHELLDVTWSRYEPGERGPDPHVHHDHADCFYILEGEAEFGLGPDIETVILRPGSFLAVPANVVHTFKNTDDTTLKFLNFHAPSGGFADGMRHGAGWDTHDPPADGGRPASEAIVAAPDTGHRIELEPGIPGPPLHRHAAMVDSFYVLSGTLTLTIDGESADLGTGDFAMVPPGTARTFANTSDAPVQIFNFTAPVVLEHDIQPV